MPLAEVPPQVWTAPGCPSCRGLGFIGRIGLFGVWTLSDDDYARISIAQGFAREPHFDPSGTSWLPAPFWAYGAAFRAFGTGLSVARAWASARLPLAPSTPMIKTPTTRARSGLRQVPRVIPRAPLAAMGGAQGA